MTSCERDKNNQHMMNILQWSMQSDLNGETKFLVEQKIFVYIN